MEQPTGSWEEIVQPNLERLTQCTILNSEIVTRLFRLNLITSSEKQDLEELSNRTYQQAGYLYKIAIKYDHQDFEHFKEAIKISGNTKALQILNNAEERHEVDMVSCKNPNQRFLIPLMKAGARTQTQHTDMHDKLSQNRSFQSPTTDANLEVAIKHRLHQNGNFLASNQETATENGTHDNISRIVCDVKALKDWSGKTDAQLQVVQTAQEQLNRDFSSIKLSTEHSNERLSAVEKNVEAAKKEQWELGDLRPFNVHKAMGTWYLIQGFKRYESFPATTKFDVEFFTLKGITIYGTRMSQRKDCSTLEESKHNFTVSTHLPHDWITADKDKNCNRRWIKTDYDSYGMVLLCEHHDISPDDILYILSRKRKMPSHTLEMLMDIAEERGFPDIRGNLDV